jgi:predicted PurR-regulated permease PerM
MEEQSSKSTRRPAAVAAVLGIAVFGVGAGFAVAGCGSDTNSKDVNSVIDSVQSQASSVSSQVSTAVNNANQQAQSIQSQVQSQVQSVQTQIQQNQNQKQNGGSGQYGY